MNDKQRRKYEMFLRTRNFMNEHAADFPANSVAGGLNTTLNDVITELAGLGADKISATGSASQAMDIKGDAREDLRDALRSVSDIAKAMAYEVNGLENKFRMPYNRSDQNLIAAGRSFAADAEPLAAQFVAYGLEAGFVDDLSDKTDAFENAVNSAGTAAQSRIGTNAAFDAPIKNGMNAVRRLIPIVKIKYRNDAARLAAWLFATHIERSPQKPLPHPTT